MWMVCEPCVKCIDVKYVLHICVCTCEPVKMVQTKKGGTYGTDGFYIIIIIAYNPFITPPL